jgi:hypothetical protein
LVFLFFFDFLGGRNINSNKLDLCAMGRTEKILKQTTENETIKENGFF